MENQMTKTTTKSQKKPTEYVEKYKYVDRRTDFTPAQLKEIEQVAEIKMGWFDTKCYSPNKDDTRYDNASLRYTLGYMCANAERNFSRAEHTHDDYFKAIIADKRAGTFETDPKAGKRLDAVVNMFAMCVYKDMELESCRQLYMKVLGHEFSNVSFTRWQNSRNNHETSDAESASDRLADLLANK